MFKKILATVDGSKESLNASGYAIDLASKYRSKLMLLSVVPFPPGEVPELLGSEEKRITKFFSNALKKVEKKAKIKKIKAKSEIRFGEPVEEILRYAKKEKVDLIVLGEWGRGVRAKRRMRLIGHVSEEVGNSADCSVLIIK